MLFSGGPFRFIRHSRKALMRKLLASLAAVALVALLTLLPGYVSPAQASTALRSLVCTSSIDWRCQPANLPILIEAGVVSLGPTGAVTTTGGGSVASLVANGLAGLGLTGVVTAVTVGELTGQSKASVKMDGVRDLVIKTDPEYEPVGATSGCQLYPDGSSPRGPVFNDDSWPFPAAEDDPSLCIPLEPFEFAWSGTGGSGSREVYFDPATSSLVFGVRTGSAYASQSYAIYRVCENAAHTLRLVTEFAGSSISSAAHSLSMTCTGTWNTLTAVLVSPYMGGQWWTAPLWNLLANDPLYPPPGPKGTARTTIECEPLGGGTAIGVVVDTGLIEVTSGGDIYVPDALCPSGYVVTETKVDWQPFGDTDWTPLVDPTPTNPDILDLPVEYPDCHPEPDSGPCTMTLWQVQPGGGLDFCGAIGQLCIGWSSDPGAPDRYECRYGPYVIDLNKCSAYRAPDQGVLPNTRTDGSTIPYNEPAPSSPTNPVVNPGTGAPVTVPLIPPGAAVQPQRAECFPTGWGVLNPVSWVLQPLQCVIEWAFVPRADALAASMNRIQIPWATKLPGQLAIAIAAWEFSPPPSGCDGITVDVWFLGPPFQIMSACPGELLADMAYWSRIFGNLGFSIYGVIAITRNVARIFEFPGLGSNG